MQSKSKTAAPSILNHPDARFIVGKIHYDLAAKKYLILKINQQIFIRFSAEDLFEGKINQGVDVSAVRERLYQA